MNRESTPRRRNVTPYPQVRRRIFDTAEEVPRSGAQDGEGGGGSAPVMRRGPRREAREREGYNTFCGIDLSKLAVYERSTEFSIPRKSFQRLVGEVLQKVGGGGANAISRVSVKALEALQIGAEEHLEFLFGDTFLLCLHEKRTTISAKDLLLARKIRGDFKLF